MNKSIFLGRVLGIYLIIISLSMLLQMQVFFERVNALIGNPALMFVVGFFTLILGVLVVVGHNVWRWDWRVLITIIGWLILLKGASIIFYPQFIDHATALFIQNMTVAYVVGGIDLLLGVVLCYFGFRR
ncbi:MAG: hypothetical protein WAW86_06820 [Gammaproteobacteria bacterium]